MRENEFDKVQSIHFEWYPSFNESTLQIEVYKEKCTCILIQIDWQKFERKKSLYDQMTALLT